MPVAGHLDAARFVREGEGGSENGDAPADWPRRARCSPVSFYPLLDPLPPFGTGYRVLSRLRLSGDGERDDPELATGL